MTTKKSLFKKAMSITFELLFMFLLVCTLCCFLYNKVTSKRILKMFLKDISVQVNVLPLDGCMVIVSSG